MTKIHTYSLLLDLMATLALFACTAQSPIERAVEKQYADYPLSELRDVYKNFFQDRFGPGHLISNPAGADKYLREELATDAEFKGPLYEPTGAEGHFYRVNLSVIRDSIVPYDVFFNAFVRSVNGIVFPSIDEWRQEWKVIEDVVARSPHRTASFEADQADIANTLDAGEYAMHHSQAYEQAYDPHYRIIERSIFENEIKPLIDNASANGQ